MVWAVWLQIFLFLRLEVVSIFNGKMVKEGQFLFVVSFGLSGENGPFIHVCGGSIIKNYMNLSWVISSAHCFEKFDKQIMYAVIGKNVIPKNPEGRCNIQKVISNEYNLHSFQNDIAIIIIKCPFSNHHSIDLSSNIHHANYDCLIFGYGSLNFTHDIHRNCCNTLLYGKVKKIEQEECENLVGRALAPMPHSGQFCARGVVDACPGDSGGAMICRNDMELDYKIFGVINYGTPCGQDSVGIYEAVASNRFWIDLILEN